MYDMEYCILGMLIIIRYAFIRYLTCMLSTVDTNAETSHPSDASPNERPAMHQFIPPKPDHSPDHSTQQSADNHYSHYDAGRNTKSGLVRPRDATRATDDRG